MKDSLKILILEDNPNDAELIKRIIKKSGIGFLSIVIDSKTDYIRQLKEYAPDIVLSDHALPQFNSHDALAILKEAAPQTPFILVTGSISEEFAVNIIKQGADDYILKDNLIRLPSAILSAIRQRETENEKRQAIEALKRSEDKFRTLIQNSSDIITLMKEDGTILFESESIERILGYSPGELLDKNAFELVHPDDLRKVLQAFQKGITIPEYAIIIEYRFKHKNGIWRIMESTGKNLLSNPDIHAVLINSRDITERKKIEEDLQYKNRELETFMYRASHDLRGPLSSLLGLVNVAEMEIKEKIASGYLNKIAFSTKKMDGILLDLVDIVKITQGSMEIGEINFDLMLNSTLANFQFNPVFSKVKIQIKNRLKNKFYSDKKLIFSILYNLAENGIKYQRKGIDPYLHISLSEKDNKVILEFKDNGQGIPKNLQPKVFDMFFRGNESSTGTGLGLYIVKKALEKVGGTIELESKEGEGSSFTVHLPNLINQTSTTPL